VPGKCIPSHSGTFARNEKEAVVNEQVTLRICAQDPVSRAGVGAALREWPAMRVVDTDGPATVAIVVADAIDDDAVRAIRAAQRTGSGRVVLLVARIDDRGLLAAVEAGICGLVRRSEASPAEIARAVRRAAAGDGTLPSDLLGRLLEQVGRLQRQVLAPSGLNLNGLSKREVEVLRLVAEGLDTSEIARSLAYSERTIKNVIHDVTSRFQLRNRSQAVAYALREGLI
jgi:DNA-binding NarL/FixJ family response regulator